MEFLRLENSDVPISESFIVLQQTKTAEYATRLFFND